MRTSILTRALLFTAIAMAPSALAATGITAAAGAPPRATFLQLGTPIDGNERYCTNCNANTSPCTGGGTGAFADRVGSVWVCRSASAGGAGTVTSVGNGTIGSLFTASWATSTTTPALSFDITNQGTVAQVLHGNASGHPSFGAVVSADLNVTGTTCSNQFLTVLSSSLAGTCTTATLASAQFANQGTTITVLHGNAAGNPSFGSVALADMAAQATNTVLVNATSGSATPTAQSVSSCSSASSALIWTTNTGFGCNSSITANTATTATSATTATNATNTAITEDTATNASVFPTWVTANTGNLPQKTTSTKFSLNPSTGTVTHTVSNTGGIAITSAGAPTLQLTTTASPGRNFMLAVQYDANNLFEILRANSGGGAANTMAFQIDGTDGTVTIPGTTVLSGQAVTAGTMTVTNSANVRKVIQRFDWTNAMVTALGATTAGDIAVCTLPAKTVVTNVYVVIDTADSSANALTVAVGRTSAAYIDYIVASDAKASANTVYGDASGERGTNLTGYDLPSITGTTVINAHFIKTTTNLSTVTASTGHIYLETMTLP